MNKLRLASVWLWLFLFSLSAGAHNINFSDSQLSLHENQATWNFRVHLGDFDAKFGRADEQAIKSYIPERMGITVGGEPCRFEKMEFIRDPGQEVVTMQLAYQCPVPRSPLHIHYDLFYGDFSHRHLMKLDALGKTFSYTFVSGQTEAEFSLGSSRETILNFLKLGFEHILSGYDHILFLLTLIFGAKRFKDLLWLVTAFTLAHSISLALSVLDIVTLAPTFVEPLIAASIVYVAVQDLFHSGKKTPWSMIFLTFGFGLIHGLGFSYVLREANLSAGHLALPLIFFNLGVELGQILVVGAVYPLLFLLAKGLKEGYLYFKRFALVSIAGIGLYWILQRIFGA